jgi:hypothetical protein
MLPRGLLHTRNQTSSRVIWRRVSLLVIGLSIALMIRGSIGTMESRSNRCGWNHQSLLLIKSSTFIFMFCPGYPISYSPLPRYLYIRIITPRLKEIQSEAAAAGPPQETPASTPSVTPQIQHVPMVPQVQHMHMGGGFPPPMPIPFQGGN